MLVVLADHSMEWSLPHQVISPQPLLDGDPLLAGEVRIAQNGGGVRPEGEPALAAAR